METLASTGYAERFEQIKSRFKLRNRDLSRIAGVSDTAINKIISGVTESPDVRTLTSLGKKLNLSAEWLFYGEGPMVKEEDVPDGSLKKGLQLRDEMISQLQKELWGKPEGAIVEPLSTGDSLFDRNFREYTGLVLDTFGQAPVSQSIIHPRSKVGGTPFSIFENTALID